MRINKIIKMSVGWILLILAVLFIICGIIVISPIILLMSLCSGIGRVARAITAFIKESFDDATTSFFDGIVRLVVIYTEFKEKYKGSPKIS